MTTISKNPLTVKPLGAYGKDILIGPTVPLEVVEQATYWHSGLSSATYALASTGGVSLNPRYVQFMQLSEQAEILSALWAGLVTELEPAFESGDIGPEHWEYLKATAELIAEQAENEFEAFA